MKKLNLGCGKNYRKDYVNLDFNHEVKADIYTDISKRLPFKDNTFDYIIAWHIIEHVPREKLFFLLEELNRICKKGAIINVRVPHFTSVIASSCPYHWTYWGIDSFKTFEPVSNSNNERYSKARFKVLKQELHFVFEHYENFPIVGAFGFLNPLFNLGYFWQRFCERTWLWGFDEIEYQLLNIKEDKNE